MGTGAQCAGTYKAPEDGVHGYIGTGATGTRGRELGAEIRVEYILPVGAILYLNYLSSLLTLQLASRSWPSDQP